MREFKTFDEQIEILKNRGLNFKNEELAKQRLACENYYNVINGFKHFFLDIEHSETETFKRYATFEEIYELYCFDREVKSIILTFILRVENELRTQVSYVFSKYHNSDNYLVYDNFENFKNDPTVSNKKREKRAYDIFKLITKIHNSISQNISKKDYINHYIMQDGTIPLWVLVNILSLGDIANLYTYMKQLERIEVSKHWNVLENELTMFLHVLAFYRNLCAHDERVFCSRLGTSILDSTYHQALNIQTSNRGYIIGKNDLFSLVITLKHLLSTNDFTNFFNRINGRIISLKTKLSSITINDILAQMGFPENWETIKRL